MTTFCVRTFILFQHFDADPFDRSVHYVASVGNLAELFCNAYSIDNAFSMVIQAF